MLLQKQRTVCIKVYGIQNSGPLSDSTVLDETWALAKRTAKAFVEADVKLPLFSTSILSSALNIFINLYGQDGLIAMMEEPEAAEHDLKMINDLIRTLHKWYREHIPAQQLQPVCSSGRTQPPGSGQLCGCTTQLISGELYEEFIAPLDDRLLSVYPHGGMIHLCGCHTQHIPVFARMKHLTSLQLNDRAAEDLEAYHKLLRKDQVIYLNPCEGMTVGKALEITRGERLVLATDLIRPVLKPK